MIPTPPTRSQNGWPVLSAVSSGPHPRLRSWLVPGTDVRLLLRDGSAGFLLIFVASWVHENLEPIDVGQIRDDWGWASRPVRGSTSVISNHASGTALDYNALRHVLGRAGTWAQAARLRLWLRRRLGATVRWGGDYVHRKDEMHFELAGGLADAERVARRLARTRRGRRVLAVNPGAGKVIHS